MTYNVFGVTLNLAQSIYLSMALYVVCFCTHQHILVSVGCLHVTFVFVVRW